MVQPSLRSSRHTRPLRTAAIAWGEFVTRTAEARLVGDIPLRIPGTVVRQYGYAALFGPCAKARAGSGDHAALRLRANPLVAAIAT